MIEIRNIIPPVFADSEEYIEKAKAVAESIGAEIPADKPEKNHENLILRYGGCGLYLEADGLQVNGDFTRMLPRLKPSNLNGEMLIKAAKPKKGEVLTAVDATAGLGDDSFLLAAAGFNVKMFEYDKVIGALLSDALERARAIPEISGIVSRMSLIVGDSVEGMKNLDFTPDIILLDPMFPERSKSGLIKKKFQLLQKLESPCSDGEALLYSAISAKPGKIIIKRPAKGPYLGDKKPSYSITGNSIRYDCIVL